MTPVMDLSQDHRTDLPEGFSRHPGGTSLKDMDQAELCHLARQQRPGTCSSLEQGQNHPVTRQTAKPGEKMRVRVPTVVQVGWPHKYSSCLLAYTHLAEGNLLTSEPLQLHKLHAATESDPVDPSLESTG